MNRTSLESFNKLFAEHKAIPVLREIPIENHTPVELFEGLCLNTPGAFLLESAEAGVWSRYSFIGINSLGMLVKEQDQPVVWTGKVAPLPSGGELSSTALGALDEMVSAWTSSRIENLPPLTNGLVGLLGWDVIREIEKLPNRPPSDFKTPELFFSMFSELIVVDHLEKKLLLVANVFKHDGVTDSSSELFEKACERLDDLEGSLAEISSAEAPVAKSTADLVFDANQSAEEFLASVGSAKEYVRIGDVFQVVLSQRFDKNTHVRAIDVYRALRVLNPSPYMYLVNAEDSRGSFNVVGSSPEALVTLSSGLATMHPIAGSRPRGVTPELDVALANELSADAKEQAEHLMLVDLARNDLLKVCQSQSVTVTEFMQIHRFSHIMHLVSTVEGRVRAGETAVDVFRATFPAGTLSGAPKPRALEIIDELEPSNRGLYGGVVGYFDFSGDADLAICIRTATLRDGVAYVQAGAGLVLDSVPESEFAETQAKASAVLRAIASAEEANV
jgi:anthranilate synthase component 1